MSAVHLHLLLSHVPVIGIFGVVLLLLIALLRRSDELARVGLATAVLVALTAVIVFLTGEPAEHAVERLAGVAEQAVEAHEEAGELALWSSVVVGLFALGALLFFRRRPQPRGLVLIALLGAGVTAGVLGWTANLGGSIRHTEIAGAAAATPRGDDDRD